MPHIFRATVQYTQISLLTSRQCFYIYYTKLIYVSAAYLNAVYSVFIHGAHSQYLKHRIFSDPVYTEERLPPPQMFRYFSYNFLRPAFFFSFKIMCSFVSFLFRAFSHSNYIFSFPTKCTCTIEHLYCLLNFCYMFRRSLRLPQEELLSLLKYVGDN